MATLILSAALPAMSSAVAGSTAAIAQAAIGAALGGFIDNAFLFPALFPPDPVHGPRLGDQEFGGSSEGTPKNYPIGRNVRVAGTVFWQSPLIEVKDTTTGGGKGGAGGDYITYKYYRHVAVAFAETALTKYKKILADGKPIYNIEPDINISSNQVSGVESSTLIQVWVGPFGNQTLEPRYIHNLTIHAAAATGVDLSVFQSGKDVILSGAVAARNNGTWKCVSAGEDPVTGDTWVKLKDPIQYLPGATNPFVNFSVGSSTITLFQEQPAYSLEQVQEISFYYGSTDQTSNELIESFETANSVPAWRGRSYVVFKQLYLFDYGNRVPNFTAIVEQDPDCTVGDALRTILLRSGKITQEQISVSATVEAMAFEGMNVRGAQSPRSSVQPILLAYNIVTRDDNGVIHFLHRSECETVTVDTNRLSAHEQGAGGDEPRPIRIHEEGRQTRLPSQVTITYLDPKSDYQSGTATAVNVNASYFEPIEFNLDLGMTNAEARKLAETLLWLAYYNKKASVNLPPSYNNLQESKILSFTAKGEDWKVLAHTIDRGINGLLEVTGYLEDVSILTRTSPGEDPQAEFLTVGENSGRFAAPEVDFHILDIPAIHEAALTVPGVYIAAALPDRRKKFSGAALYESVDGGTTYHHLTNIHFETIMGVANGILAGTRYETWDDTNTVDIYLGNGAVYSVTELECLNGQNRFLIGSEIIGAMNVTYQGNNVYRLSRLLRGLRGTEWAMGGHLAGERAVYLNSPGLQFVPLTLSAVDTTRQYKLVAPGGYLEEANYVDFQFFCCCLRPFAPVNITGTRDGSNNLTVDFTRRTRALVRDFMPTSTPILEREESYQVEARNGSGVTVRTIPSATPTGIGYTAAQQTTDGLTPGDPVPIVVYQDSDTVLYGQKVLITV